MSVFVLVTSVILCVRCRLLKTDFFFDNLSHAIKPKLVPVGQLMALISIIFLRCVFSFCLLFKLDNFFYFFFANLSLNLNKEL